MMNTTLSRTKRKDVLIVIEHVVKQCVMEGYVKATEKSLTTSGTTVLADSRTYQLVWYLAQQTGVVNHLGLSNLLK